MNTTDNLKYLKTLVGEEASFHIDQEDAINSCLEKVQGRSSPKPDGGNQQFILSLQIH